jgi:4-hydroxybenzoate polyprenyltransferase
MKALTFDRINEAQIEDPGGTFPAGVSATHTGEPATDQEVAAFKVDSYLPGDVRLSMTLEKKRFVVVNEGWSSGWRAYIDGSPTQIYRTNYLVQGVVVPPGPHTVHFQYDPPAFKAGLAISGVGLVAWLGLVGTSVWGAIRRKKYRVPSTEYRVVDNAGTLHTRYSVLGTGAALWRVLHPLPSLLTVVAAGAFVVLAARGVPPLGRLALLLFAEAAMQFSISAFNDYFDREADVGRPNKPVAHGLVSPRAAWLMGLALGLASIALTLPLGLWVTLLTAIGLGGGLLYDAGLKYTAFSWLPFCIAFPTLPLWGWVGAHPDGPFPLQLLWVVPVGAVLVLAIHMADTIPDLAHDASAGVRGLAHRIGLRWSLALCWGAPALGALITLALWPFIPYRPEAYLPGLALGLLLLLAGTGVYLRDHARVKMMSFLVEMGAMVLAVGWVGAIM